MKGRVLVGLFCECEVHVCTLSAGFGGTFFPKVICSSVSHSPLCVCVCVCMCVCVCTCARMCCVNARTHSVTYNLMLAALIKANVPYHSLSFMDFYASIKVIEQLLVLELSVRVAGVSHHFQVHSQSIRDVAKQPGQERGHRPLVNRS